MENYCFIVQYNTIHERIVFAASNIKHYTKIKHSSRYSEIDNV